MQKAFRYLLVRLGVAGTVAVVVAVTVVFSVAVASLVAILFLQVALVPTLIMSVVTPILVATPVAWQFCVIIRDLDKAERELKILAMTDELTGLDNRRQFVEMATRHISYIRRFGGEAALIVLDIDHFKKINDTYGHQVGDDVLKSLVPPIRSQLREVDTFARIGGEEFAVLLPHAGLEMALRVAERIRQAVAKQCSESCPEGIELTVSLGVAATEGANAQYDELFDQADKALYAAKQNGRNRTEVVPAVLETFGKEAPDWVI